MGINAYKKTIKHTASPREIEHKVFQRVTSNLKPFAGVKGFDALSEDFKRALWENQLFWNALRTDLVVPDNALSRELRAQLLSLAAFVDNQTAEILKGKATVDPILEVNNTIMKGLAAAAESTPA